MTKFLIACSVVFLAACSSTQVKPADVLAKTCPVVQGTILTLGVTEGISDKTKDKLKEVTPVVAAACSAGSVNPDNADIGVNILLTTGVPLLMDAINESNLKDDQKQAALIALVAAQVVLAGTAP
jgi:hypothetical protein